LNLLASGLELIFQQLIFRPSKAHAAAPKWLFALMRLRTRFFQ
jgi:hypothetical protein